MTYLIVGGNAFSQTDGQTHFIPVWELQRLYQLPPLSCRYYLPHPAAGRTSCEEELVVLRPRADGNYTVRGKQMVAGQGQGE
jgi:hypothetical protein